MRLCNNIQYLITSQKLCIISLQISEENWIIYFIISANKIKLQQISL